MIELMNCNKQTIVRILTVCILFLCGVEQVMGQSKNLITIHHDAITLAEVFELIEKQSGYSIAYAKSGIDLETKGSFHIEKKDIDETMLIVLKGKPLTYQKEGYHIIIKPIEGPKSVKEDKPDEQRRVYVAEVQTEQKQYQYSGIVKDSYTQEPLSYAVVSLVRSDNQVLTNSITNDEGFFRIGANEDPDMLKISFIGYKEYVLYLKGQRNLDVILLTENQEQLRGVTVSAETVDHKVDRISYWVTGEMRERSSNAVELLDHISGVRYDKVNGNIKVGNETSVLLLVDGVQQSEEYVRNLPPERILRIEVITEPTGLYLSEGYSAIINMILKNDYTGYDIMVRNFAITNLGGNNGDNFLTNEQPGLGVTYTNKKVNLFANYTYARTRWNTPVEQRKTYEDLKIMESAPFDVKNPNERYKYHANTVGTGVNYQFNPKHSLSFQSDYAYEKSNTETEFQYKVSDVQPFSFFKDQSERTHNINSSNDYTGTFFYKGEISKKWKIYADYTYNYYGINVNDSFNQDDTYFQNNKYSANRHMTKSGIDAIYDYSSFLSFNAGHVGTTRLYNSKDKDGTILLEFEEVRSRSYVYAQMKFSNQLILKGGAGLETIHAVDKISESERRFVTVQPYLHLNYDLTKNINMKVGYTTNVYYPSLYQLSPSSTSLDSLMIQTGNPALKSVLRHSISYRANFWNRLTLNSMFKFTPKRISEVYQKDGDKYSSTFDNISVNQYMLQAIYDQPLGRYFNLSGSYVHYFDNASSGNIRSSLNGWLLDAELKFFHPKHLFGVDMGYYRNLEKSILLQGYQTINMDGWMITLNKQFMNKRGAVMLSYLPPVGWGVKETQQKEIVTPFYKQNYVTSLKPYQNTLFLRFSLRFNSGKVQSSEKQSTIEREERGKRNVDF